MENLILSFNVVLPLFLCIVLGYFLRFAKMYDDTILNGITKLCFKVFLPIYLFYNVYTTDLSAAFNGKLILYAAIASVTWFLFLMILVPKIEKRHEKCGVMIQGMFRSNFILFGLPIAISLCGENNVGPTSLLIGIIVPIYNVLAVITLEIFRGGKPNVRKIVKGILTNPLILASASGACLYLLNINLPDVIEKTMLDLGRIATPLALIALGGGFKFSKLKSDMKLLTISVAGKLVIFPCIAVTIGILLGFRNEMLVPILLMAGSPTAVASYPMAQQMGGDGELAGEIIVFTTGIAILTMFLWIFALKQLGYI